MQTDLQIEDVQPKSHPSLGELTASMLRIGNTTFGGGFITVMVIGREFMARKWLTQSQFDLVFSLSRIVPGTNIVAFCAGIGIMLNGWPGALLSVAALNIPCAIISVLLLQGFESWKSNPWVMAGLVATTAAVTGMMWSTVTMLTKPHLGSWQKSLRTAVLFGFAFGAAWLGVTPVPIVIGTVALGILWGEPLA